MYSERPPEIEMIRQMARESMNNNRPATQAKFTESPFDCNDDLISVRRANEWFSNGKLARPKMLFGSFWFENELCIMFADTNTGKSILAVQLGHSLCTGNPIGPYQVQLPASTVVYFDFEQSAAQFEARYTGVNHAFKFSPNFFPESLFFFDASRKHSQRAGRENRFTARLSHRIFRRIYVRLPRFD